MKNYEKMEELDWFDLAKFCYSAGLEDGVNAGSHGVDYVQNPEQWFSEWKNQEYTA